MKSTIKYVTVLFIAVIVLSSCSQVQEQSMKEMLKNSDHQEQALTMMVENHDLSMRYIDKMMKNDHATGMMVNGLVKAAAEDSVLAEKLSDMIVEFPDLMLMTMHHFMPVINANEDMCDGFCDHAMEQTNIAEGMCNKMQEEGEMSCCNK